jgi:hypothetical protein
MNIAHPWSSAVLPASSRAYRNAFFLATGAFFCTRFTTHHTNYNAFPAKNSNTAARHHTLYLPLVDFGIRPHRKRENARRKRLEVPASAFNKNKRAMRTVEAAESSSVKEK